MLELKVAKFAMMTFTKMFPTAKTIHLQMDNIVVLSDLLKMGGHNKILSDLRNLGLCPSKWDHNYCRVFIGNPEFECRSAVKIHIGLEWMEIKPNSFRKIEKVFSYPDMDLFASKCHIIYQHIYLGNKIHIAKGQMPSINHGEIWQVTIFLLLISLVGFCETFMWAMPQ